MHWARGTCAVLYAYTLFDGCDAPCTCSYLSANATEGRGEQRTLASDTDGWLAGWPAASRAILYLPPLHPRRGRRRIRPTSSLRLAVCQSLRPFVSLLIQFCNLPPLAFLQCWTTLNALFPLYRPMSFRLEYRGQSLVGTRVCVCVGGGGHPLLDLD